ncbi:hypothetical protein [Rosistilla oblonga]|uniref:hypothetical protein n=1 Tax=Rosistilla oblonga TaxID=2527990 RepID=UPI003A973432
MLKIDRQNQNFTVLDAPTLADVSITERYDLQEFICNSPDAFFKEIGQELFLIGKEVLPSKNVQDRIDVLALDKEGCCVIVELKRGNHKLHMFQAISYAGMISQWSSEVFLSLLDEGRQEELADFLEVDKDDINRQQRIILVAEAYDYSLLIGAEWLSERFGVDVACCRIAVAKDSGTNSEYLVCSNVYPAPELANEAGARGRKATTPSKLKWSNWEQALENVANSDLATFYKQELEADQESYLRKRILRYRLSGKRRWFVAARKERAYVWQHGRFEGDIDFWKNGLTKPDEVKPVKDEACLRLFLHSAEDFRFFKDSVASGLASKTWEVESSATEDIEESPEE